MSRNTKFTQNPLSTPLAFNQPLLTTPILASSPIPRHFDGPSFSTLTISPLPANNRLLFNQKNQKSSQPDPDSIDSIKSQVERLRLWRHDAYMQHQYQTAGFIGDKVLAFTNDANDAFWLAQVYYDTGHYARARGILLKRDLLDASAACRYLAALCLTKLSKWHEALELLGEENPFRSGANIFSDNGSNDDRPIEMKSQDGGVKLEASMCYLRGFVYTHLNNLDRAKDNYKEALYIDAKCYEAWDQLLANSLMNSDEEWLFLEALPFNGLDAADVDFVHLMYTLRLSKYKSKGEFEKVEGRLKKEYHLENNADVLLSRGDYLFVRCRFVDCLAITEKILDIDRFKFDALPLHLSCLHELGKKNELFLLSHDLADKHPAEPVTWLAIGIYYMSTGRVTEARRYFSKASVMNPRFGPAWIGFAHSFAIEGEHDQAISAYTTAARLFQGTHLPALFLGMQHLQLNNIVLAEEYLNSAYKLCETDPLLLNEMGVICFHKTELEQAIQWFQRTLLVAKEIESDEKAWVATWANLGHACRKLKLYDDAIVYFTGVIRLTPADAGAYAAIALIHLQRNEPGLAVDYLHQSLSLAPGDPLATDMLSRALEENALVAFNSLDERADIDINNLLSSIKFTHQCSTLSASTPVRSDPISEANMEYSDDETKV